MIQYQALYLNRMHIDYLPKKNGKAWHLKDTIQKLKKS